MAIAPRILSSGVISAGSRPNFEAEHVLSVVFAPDGAITHTDTLVEALTPPDRGDVWPLLTAVFYDDLVSGWKPWTFGRSIEGFMLGASGVNSNGGPYTFNRSGRQQLHTTDQTIGLVILGGQFHYPELPLPPGETVLNFQAALRSGTRENNLKIMGLDGVH